MIKLNGWRRLGIVIFSSWVLGAASIAVYEGASHSDGHFVGLTLPVGTVVIGSKAKLPGGRMVDINTTINGRPVKPWEIKWDNQPEIPTEQVIHWRKLLIYSVICPMLLWASFELLAFVGSWVSRGFRADRAS